MKAFICICLFSGIVWSGSAYAEEPKTVDKEKRANILRVLELQGMTGLLERAKKADPVMRDQMKETFESLVGIYDKHYNNNEILELIKLFESPAWKLYKEKSLFIGKEMLEASKASIEKTKSLIEAEKEIPVSKMTAAPDSSLGRMLIKSKEARTNASLNRIRSAVTIYYSENEGKWPKSLTDGFEKYLAQVPAELITGSNKIAYKFDGTGGWCFNLETGSVVLNLEGKDSAGTEYSKY